MFMCSVISSKSNSQKERQSHKKVKVNKPPTVASTWEYMGHSSESGCKGSISVTTGFYVTWVCDHLAEYCNPLLSHPDSLHKRRTHQIFLNKAGEKEPPNLFSNLDEMTDLSSAKLVEFFFVHTLEFEPSLRAESNSLMDPKENHSPDQLPVAVLSKRYFLRQFRLTFFCFTCNSQL